MLESYGKHVKLIHIHFSGDMSKLIMQIIYAQNT